ncbi:hypothetical protein FACS1894200_07020 [Spirochaetia bacterium]|nr:hypothetical protein FACS1894200_07020 [Spirochaetia bacterium]
MNGKIVFDTNIIIHFWGSEPDTPNLRALMLQYDCLISVITRIELLSYWKITEAELNQINLFLDELTVIPLTDEVVQKTIEFRRCVNRKSPDSIIAATAILMGATFLTQDPHLLKSEFPGLIVSDTL